MRFHQHIISSIYSLVFCFLLICSLPSFGTNQDSLKWAAQSAPEKYYRRSALTDSLTSLLLSLSIQQDSLRGILKTQKATILDGENERAQLAEENENLKEELNGAMGVNLQSSHTKTILFIFNLIVGIFLLIAVIWMFMRKKSDANSKPFNNSSSSNQNGNIEGYDHKLERIEKLGNLRDKGLLTDDEFNLQKRQILGDRN